MGFSACPQRSIPIAERMSHWGLRCENPERPRGPVRFSVEFVED